MSSRSVLAALLVSGLLVPASSANAQEAKPAPADAKAGVTFDPASLEAALKGMQAFKTKMADAAASSEQFTAAQKRITALRAENQLKVEDYTSTRDGVNRCLRAFSASRTGDRTSQVQRKVMAISSDQPALEKFSLEYARLSQSLTAATARKDSAEMQKVNADLTALLTLDAKGDSIAGAKRCGVLPAKPPAVVQIEEQQAIVDGLHKTMATAADSAGARAAGVPPARFTQMRERLAQFIANDSAFVGKEGELLKTRRAEIETTARRDPPTSPP